jgi:toxin FitB
MIIVDTNVVSDPLSPRPEPRVERWFNRHVGRDLYITSITLAEMMTGAERLPLGRRRDGLFVAIEEIANVQFAGRILPFEAEAARQFGKLSAMFWRQGTNCKMADVQMAAIAASLNASIATRDIKAFQAAGLRVINPWTDE